MKPTKSDLLQGALDLLILKIVALGPVHLAADRKATETGREAKFYRLTREGRKQLETESQGWQRLTEAVGLILNLSEGGAK